MDWAVRPATEDDVPAIVQLFGEVFGRRMGEDEYRWKHFRSPVCFAAPAYVATRGERVIAHYGATPMLVRASDRDRLALHSSDVMVAREFRRRGVMTAVGRTAHAGWRAAGAEFVVGLPPLHLGDFRELLDYRPVLRLGWCWLPLRPAAVLRARLRPTRRRASGPAALEWLWRAVLARDGSGVEVTRVDESPRDLDELWRDASGRYGALIVRNREWVAYRYGDAPKDYRLLLARVAGRPAGYLAYRSVDDGGRRIGWVADVFAAPEARDVRTALIRAAARALAADGATDLRLFTVRSGPLAAELRRLAFVPRRGEYDICVVPLVDDVPWQVLRDPASFVLAGGDFDVV